VGYREIELDLGKWRGQGEGTQEGNKKGKGIDNRGLASNTRAPRLGAAPRVKERGSLGNNREG
jgi:hypothetical protein